jgi:HSP20 family protein
MMLAQRRNISFLKVNDILAGIRFAVSKVTTQKRRNKKGDVMKNSLQNWRENLGPFRELEKMQRSMERLFGDLTPLKAELADSFNPSCDISDDSANYYFKFDLPGVPKNQIKVELSGNVLTVSAERKEAKEKKEGRKQYLSEVYYGSYNRSFTLPNEVDEKRIDAKYENGVLTLTVPKVGKEQAKQITVQ